MDLPIKAYAGEGDSVIYEYADGKQEKYSGGDRNWRNRNPGNVLSNNQTWNGKIGVAGGFCIFDDPEHGKRATRKILDNRRREKKTLSEAIYSYAPTNENDTESYVKDVAKRTGILRTTVLLTLSAEQMESIAQAMFIHEGTKIGKITLLKSKKPQKTGLYIWHTAHDEKVRSAHAARDGKVFDFANPPPGGNPGEDYNCRCTAEPIPSRSLEEVFKK